MPVLGSHAAKTGLGPVLAGRQHTSRIMEAGEVPHFAHNGSGRSPHTLSRDYRKNAFATSVRDGPLVPTSFSIPELTATFT